ncbi:ABC transporter substrate-binding protein, partial [Candidatus Sumerlaeota bacterium]|nr:ABC transporter substrate-binding protein [Candidatus Sumerlaeota bacterium]
MSISTQSRSAGLPRVAFLVAILGAVSCSDGSKPETDTGPLLIDFWHAMGAPEHQVLLHEFAEEYNATHAGVRIEPVFQGVYPNLYQKLIASVTSGNPPVMAQMYESWTTRLYNRDRLDAVQNHLDGPGGLTEQELSDFYPAFLEDNRWNGQLVTMPFSKSAYVLHYNADLLRRAGFTEAPGSWEELRQAALAVSQLQSETGREIRGMLVRSQLESFATLYFSAGGRFLDSNLEPRMNSPLSLRTLSFLADLIHRDRAAFADTNYPAGTFGTGLVGMYIYSSAAFPFNDRFVAGKFEWRAAPVPSPQGFPSEKRRTLFQGTNIGIFKNHPREMRDAAWDFLKFILEPERVAAWSMQTGYVPVRRSALDR